MSRQVRPGVEQDQNVSVPRGYFSFMDFSQSRVGWLLRAAGRGCLVTLAAFLPACSSLLPHGETETQSPWRSFEDAQQTLDQVVPNKTTVEDLRALGLDPKVNPNITILNYSDILRRFIPSPSIDAAQLDKGVQDCIAAKATCIGYEVEQKSMKRKRYGNFFSDFLNFRRKTDIVGWRFNAVILIKDGVVAYKLTGGQPLIHEHEESTNPLGPFQSWGPQIIGP